MRTINEGDFVRVWFSGGESMRGTVMHTPANTCDLWFIRREDGTDSAINPVANEFVSMDKIDKPHPTTKGEK
jgi:hypothetical protein